MASLVIGLTALALILARPSGARSLDGAAGAARHLVSSRPDRRW
jgi:hypothetical protein